VAVAYVFMHLLPEIGAHGAVFARELALADTLAESAVYALALAGLALFYSIERLLAASRADAAEGGQAERPSDGVFWLHIASSALLMVVIGYLLSHREDNSLPGLALFFIAMMLHLVTADYGSRREHKVIYDAAARWVLAAATLGGWALGRFTQVSELGLGALFAFLGGGIVLVVLKEELPEQRRSKIGPFLLGTALYALLAAGETALISG
jgi:zinc transporter ZupT